MPKLSFEGVVGIVLGLLALVLDQAGVHVPIVLWGSFCLALLLCLDALRRSELVKRRKCIWSAVVLIAFGCFGTYLANQKQEVTAESLRAKYPLGYVLFTADSQTTFIRRNTESKADFSIDWESCRVAFSDASFADIYLRDFSYLPTHIHVHNLDVVLARKIGTVADGLFFNNVGLFVELIDDKADDMTYVIGLKKINSVPVSRDLKPDVEDFIREHLHKPMLSAINTADKQYININDLVISSGWTATNK